MADYAFGFKSTLRTGTESARSRDEAVRRCTVERGTISVAKDCDGEAPLIVIYQVAC